MRDMITAITGILGAAAICAGAFWFNIGMGIASIGVFLIASAYFIMRGAKRNADSA